MTEPHYLSSFNRIHGSKSTNLVLIPLGQDPRSVVERAIYERSQSKLDPNARFDSFWAMFDRDDHTRFNEAVDLAKANRLPTAISNPCFELWALLHYELADAPSDRHACQRKLGKLCSEYGKSGKRWEDELAILHQHDDAVRRARQLLARRQNEGNPFGNPSTTVGELTQQVRGLEI